MKSKKTFPRKKIGASTRPAKADSRKSSSASGRRPLAIPPILLEGDSPTTVAASGPGQRYTLGPTPPSEHFPPEGELPEAYGTGHLLLTARDPHWLYAHWDFTRSQQRHYNSISEDGHLVLRVHQVPFTGSAFQEVHVHPESRHWFIHVAQAGTRYAAELGYYDAREKWVTLSTSRETTTPPDSASTDTTAEFTAIPLESPMEKLIALVKERPGKNLPLAKALQELQATGSSAMPPGAPLAEWTPDRARALAEAANSNPARGESAGSFDIAELMRRGIVQGLGELGELGELMGHPGMGGGGSPAAAWGGGISSPSGGGAPPGKSFWFNVNAELILYGATEPTAQVTLGGRPIKLRPDGSFSYRFALPDGWYELPVTAISHDKTDGRAAILNFSRLTETQGAVDEHPQDPELKPPDETNF